MLDSNRAVGLIQAYDTQFQHTVNFIYPHASHAGIKRKIFSVYLSPGSKPKKHIVKS